MSFDPIRERQENRGDQLPASWIHPPSGAGQEIKAAIEIVIDIHPVTHMENDSCSKYSGFQFEQENFRVLKI